MPDPPFENFLTTRSLNGLRQKGCHILVKNWIFGDPFHKKNDKQWLFWCQWWSDHQDQEVFWGNWTLEAVEASELTEATDVNEAGEVSKAWKITTEDFRVNNILEFTFTLMFWGNLFLWYNHEISYWILAPFLSEAVEASWCQFFENWLMKPKCTNLLKPLGTINQ